jgi:hypothetical protein
LILSFFIILILILILIVFFMILIIRDPSAGYDDAAPESRLSGLLETSRRIGVRPDSVQVLGGTLYSGLPTRVRVWLSSGLRTVGRRDEAWLKRGLPCS